MYFVFNVFSSPFRAHIWKWAHLLSLQVRTILIFMELKPKSVAWKRHPPLLTFVCLWLFKWLSWEGRHIPDGTLMSRNYWANCQRDAQNASTIPSSTLAACPAVRRDVLLALPIINPLNNGQRDTEKRKKTMEIERQSFKSLKEKMREREVHTCTSARKSNRRYNRYLWSGKSRFYDGHAWLGI